MTRRIAILFLVVGASLSAQRKLSYSYETVFSTKGPVAGKQPLAIKGISFNDSGDVAVLAICSDGPAIWQKSRNAWIVWRGKQVTSAQGKPGKIVTLGKPSLAPNGSIRYRASYTLDDNHSFYGYFVDNKLIYETNQIYPDEVFTPDNKVIIATPEPVIADGSQLRGPLPKFFPPNADWKVLGNWYMVINQQTGHDGFLAGVPHNGSQAAAYYVNNKQLIVVPPGPQSSPAGLFLNSKDELAFSLNGVGDRIYVNAKPTGKTGTLLGFNDDRDLLYFSSTLPELIDRIWLNDTVVIERGDYKQYGLTPKPRLGIPEMKDRGFVYAYLYPALNNKRQVAFGIQFIPMGVFPKQMDLGQNISDISNNGVKLPWEIMIATPKP